MHKQFDFTKQGGFPLTQEVLAFMQEGYSDLSAAMAGVFGNNAIVSGCEINTVNQTVSSGFIVFNNELLPFAAGDVAQDGEVYFNIINIQSQLIFINGTSQTVKFNKYAQPDGYSQAPNKLSDLKRNGNLEEKLNTINVQNFQGNFTNGGTYDIDVITRGNICEVRGQVAAISGISASVSNIIPSQSFSSSTKSINFKTSTRGSGSGSTAANGTYLVTISTNGNISFAMDYNINVATGPHYFSQTFIL